MICYHLEAAEPVEIDLTDFFDDDAVEIAIDGCMQRSLIEAGYLTAVSRYNLHRLANYLQVAIGDRILMFNVNAQRPTLVNEIEESEKLMDP